MTSGLIGAHTRDEVIAQFGAHVSSGKVRFFESSGIDFVPGRREGPFIWDISGSKRLIDCHCNGGVYNLGHRYPEVVNTLKESLEELDIGNSHLISEQRAALGRKLAGLAPGNLPYTVFGVGGGEAIDLAIKIARGFTGRDVIISAKGGYHGHTGLALAAGDERYRAPFGTDLPDFLQVPYNNLGALERAVDRQTAAVLLETIPATFGMVMPSLEYMAGVRALCDAHGAILIVDEVQAGLGRTGRLWGIEHFGVEPDIMVIGKGLSGGIYPITATCFRAEHETVFHVDPFIHVSTFGGAEVGCPVAAKVLDIVSDPAFLLGVQELGAVFGEGFERLQARHPDVLVGLRQTGLMMGIEMADELLGPLFSKAAFENGFLSVYANNSPRVAQLLPPLTINRDLAEEILERTDRALSGVERMLESSGSRRRLL